MPKINLDKDTHARLQAFHRLGRLLGGEELTLDLLASTLILTGMDATLSVLLADQDPPTLLQSFQKLAARHPAEVYDFVADVLETGDEVQREQAKQRFGFHAAEKDVD